MRGDLERELPACLLLAKGGDDAVDFFGGVLGEGFLGFQVFAFGVVFADDDDVFVVEGGGGGGEVHAAGDDDFAVDDEEFVVQLS